MTNDPVARRVHRHICQEIRLQMSYHRWTVEEVARRVGINRQTFWLSLNPDKGGKIRRHWRPHEIYRLAELFGVSVAAFYPPAGSPLGKPPDTLGEAEWKAARRLGVPVASVNDASERLWGRSLTDRRDLLVAELVGPDADARSLQAHRGHVTRMLLAELADVVGATSVAP